MSHHNQLLDVSLTEDRVEISIGRSALMNFLKHSDQWPTHQSGRALRVLDEEEFLEQLCSALMQEAEDGETVLHTAFQEAANIMFEDGTETVEAETSIGADGFEFDDEVDEPEIDDDFDNGFNHAEWN